MQCVLCEKKLETKQVQFCDQCKSFIEWKYGSLEEFQKKRNMEVNKNE